VGPFDAATLEVDSWRIGCACSLPHFGAPEARACAAAAALPLTRCPPPSARCSGYPQLQSFISDASKEFGAAFKVAYKYGSPPTLVLKGRKGVAKHSLRVDRWSSDNVRDYLRDKLAAGKEAAAVAR
jgi:hypothetical protein